MSIHGVLGSKIIARELLIQELLKESTLVGGIYTMGFRECAVLTNDLWKKQAAGVPEHAFLLATAMTEGEAPDVDDEEVLLLRVEGSAKLPAEDNLVEVRAQAMREMIVQKGSTGAASSPAILDVLTRNEIQFSAVKCRILGTFTERIINGKPLLVFEPDIETYYSASRYKVYKPHGHSLELIASYPMLTEEEERRRQAENFQPRRVRIGHVRYTASRRRALASDKQRTTLVPVFVNVEDFVSMKTAVFGMTRFGKSNTMKIIATMVAEHATLVNEPIGQLLFDPAGEYANVNEQDKTALSQLGPEFVVRYRLGADPEGKDGFRPLATNFYSDKTIEITWSIVHRQLSLHDSQYVKNFLTVDIIGPTRDSPGGEKAQKEEDKRNTKRAARRRSAFYAALIRAGFALPKGKTFEIEANEAVRDRVNAQLTTDGNNEINVGKGVALTPQQLVAWWDALCKIRDTSDFKQNTKSTSGNDWVDPDLENILVVFEGEVGSGFKVLNNCKIFHNVSRDTDYATEIYEELQKGKIVIVDLSRGNELIQQFCSEQIVNRIIQKANYRFTSGEPPIKMQIFIEEAHRLFNRENMKDIEDKDPYVRLAKEAAKYKIGLIYATQEVSSVDPLILSNTSNWIVTHLNNHSEIKELSKYYDYETFKELTLSAEEVGFARIKTKSNRYIVPVQVDLFDATRIAEARETMLKATTGKVKVNKESS